MHRSASRRDGRAYTWAAKRAWDIPHLVGALCAGEMSLDKVRAVADVATADTERGLRGQAERARSPTSSRSPGRAPSWPSGAAGPAIKAAPAESEHDRRSVRCNDQCRTMTAQLPPEYYAETKAALEARPGDQVPSEAQTPWDQRRCDGLMEAAYRMRRVRGVAVTTGGRWWASPYLVVAHVPLNALADTIRDERSTLVGELEHVGLIDLVPPCARSLVTPRSPWQSTTTSGTPCTRAGPGVSRAMPSAERSCGGIAIVGSLAVPT